jgi:hypothetical protein
MDKDSKTDYNPEKIITILQDILKDADYSDEWIHAVVKNYGYCVDCYFTTTTCSCKSEEEGDGDDAEES